MCKKKIVSFVLSVIAVVCCCGMVFADNNACSNRLSYEMQLSDPLPLSVPILLTERSSSVDFDVERNFGYYIEMDVENLDPNYGVNAVLVVSVTNEAVDISPSMIEVWCEWPDKNIDEPLVFADDFDWLFAQIPFYAEVGYDASDVLFVLKFNDSAVAGVYDFSFECVYV